MHNRNKSDNMLVRLAKFVGYVFSWCVCWGTISEGIADERRQIWAQFQARQAAAQTVRITWSECLLRPWNNDQRSGHSDSSSPIETDRAYPEHPASLILLGDRVRYEHFIVSDVAGLENQLVRTMSAFDGEVLQTLSFSRITGGGERPHKEFDEWGNVHLWGIFMNVRPLNHNLFGADYDKWQIIERPSIIDGAPCVVIRRRQTGSPSPRAEYVHLDKNRAYVPLRYESIAPRLPSIRVEMKYEGDTPIPVPTSWTAGAYVGNRPIDVASRNNLTEVRLDVEIADDTFKLAFPAGAHLTIMKPPGPNGQRQFDQFIVGTDESSIPLRTAVSRQTSTAEVATRVTSRWWLSVLAVGCVSLGVALLLWRHSLHTPS